MAKKIRWGVISTANIGTQKVIPGMQRSKRGTVDAIASRDLKRGRAAAKKLGIPKAYGSYEEMLADPEIDAIYNPLPNNLHIDWTIEALKAGKHVLCEKPFGMSAKDAARVLKHAKGKHVMEAFMIRFHPQWLKARELIRSGRIGDLKAVQVFFCFNNVDPKNIRNIPETGGGAIYDIGGYGILSGRFTFEAEPKRIVSLIDWDPTFKTDRLTSVLADFGEGRQLTFTISTQLARASARNARRHQGADRNPDPVQRAAGGDDDHPHRQRLEARRRLDEGDEAARLRPVRGGGRRLRDGRARRDRAPLRAGGRREDDEDPRRHVQIRQDGEVGGDGTLRGRFCGGESRRRLRFQAQGPGEGEPLPVRPERFGAPPPTWTRRS